MTLSAYELNFDGIVGPTHNYGGLSYGNVASIASKMKISNPREAALQGLYKMNHLHKLGVRQAVLPPHDRPLLPILQRLGFTGSNEAEVIARAAAEAPVMLIECSSAAAMWTANAATMTPSIDSQDGKMHITPANLSAKFHRSIEAPFTTKLLKAIFPDEKYFVHHPVLPPGTQFLDEGAANYSRFCTTYDQAGVHLFVFGKYAFKENAFLPQRFPPRQTAEASQAIVRRHKLSNNVVMMIQQNPEAIDAGVFHNDVIAVGNQDVFFYHEKSFVGTEFVVEDLRQRFLKVCYKDITLIPVPEKQVSLKEAVDTYLFNSQIVTLPNGAMHLVAPVECQTNPNTKAFIDAMIESQKNPINDVYYINLMESMGNGGGPACLRLRAVLNVNELRAMHQGILFTDALYLKLKEWVRKHYRDKLALSDLKDPNLIKESRAALDELTKILKLGSIYGFQS